MHACCPRLNACTSAMLLYCPSPPPSLLPTSTHMFRMPGTASYLERHCSLPYNLPPVLAPLLVRLVFVCFDKCLCFATFWCVLVMCMHASFSSLCPPRMLPLVGVHVTVTLISILYSARILPFQSRANFCWLVIIDQSVSLIKYPMLMHFKTSLIKLDRCIFPDYMMAWLSGGASKLVWLTMQVLLYL